jgi:hypothetical protein
VGMGENSHKGRKAQTPYCYKKIRAFANDASFLVSKLNLVYPLSFTTLTRRSKIGRPTSLQRCAVTVLMDLISPCTGDTSFNAPHPNSSSLPMPRIE